MARTALTINGPEGPYSGTMASATFEAADVSNGNKFTITGDEVIHARNTDTTSNNVILKSVKDDLGRKGDVTLSVSASSFVVKGPMARDGWENSSGEMDVSANSNKIEFSIYRNADT